MQCKQTAKMEPERNKKYTCLESIEVSNKRPDTFELGEKAQGRCFYQSYSTYCTLMGPWSRQFYQAISLHLV